MVQGLKARRAVAQKHTNVSLHPLEQHLSSPEHGESSAHMHWPALQRLVLLPQPWPQLPQLLVSVDRLLQLLLQQVWPEPQAPPQLPQLASSLVVSTQLPLQHV